MQKILIIEDEENIRELIRYNLTAEGFDCVEAADGEEGLALALSQSPDLIILDLMLPVTDGFEVVKRLRMEGLKIPVIILTAKADEIDKVIGLEFGADDYVTKPFSVRELIARIRAALRRYDRSEKPVEAGGGDTGSGRDVIRIDDLCIDAPAHEVTVGGRSIMLTFKEFELLHTLAENRGIVLTREQLLDKVWGYEYMGETRTVDVHVRYLRKKLGGDENRYIVTIRGLGYKMPGK